MTEPTQQQAPPTRALIAASLPRRYRAEQRFRFYGRSAILLAIGALTILLFSITSQGFAAFAIYRFNLPIELKAQMIDPDNTGDAEIIAKGKYRTLIQQALNTAFPDVTTRSEKRKLYSFSTGLNAVTLRDQVLKHRDLIGTQSTFTAPVSDDIDLYFKGKATPRMREDGNGPLRAVALNPQTINLSGEADIFNTLVKKVNKSRGVLANTLEKRAQKLLNGIDQADNKIATVRREQAIALQQQAQLIRDTTQKGEYTLEPTDPSLLIGFNDGFIKVTKLSNQGLTGTTLIAPQSFDTTNKWQIIALDLPQKARRVSDQQAAWAEALLQRGFVKRGFNSIFFTHADSREPELAGIAGAMVGSVFTLLATMLTAVPIGILAAIYLEEFAPKNRFTGFIEVNINNLAAVPSIIFGLLGLAVFLNLFHLPRSAPLVGGLVLALMTLPVIIIASRAAIKAVPPSIREAALGIGASPTQTVFDHVLPLAAPGILTGTIIGLSRALGETAPLLMIGMVAFIADIPNSITSPSTALPVQIYLWASSAERAWESRTAAAIIILLLLMIVFNLTAVFLRHKFERRW